MLFNSIQPDDDAKVLMKLKRKRDSQKNEIK